MFVEFMLFVATMFAGNSTGAAIVMLSFGINLITLPIYNVAEQWQEKERAIQKKMKSKIADIKAVFKGDERYMILSTYYRQNNYHPFYALRSMFALFIQIPFFIAAYHLLSDTPILKDTGFLFLKNLAAPDALFTIGTVSVNVLPIAMTIINIAASAVYTKGLALKDKLTLYLTAFLFFVLLYNSPAGLVLYWTLNNIFSLFKNIFYRIKISSRTWFVVSVVSSALMTLLAALTTVGKKPILLVGSFTILLLLVPFFKRLFMYHERMQKNPVLDDNKTRAAIFLLAISAFLLLTALVIPSTTIASSPQEFAAIENINNPLSILYYPLIQSLGICMWLLCLYKLFSPTVQRYFTYIALFILMCALVNAFLFTGNYGDINAFLLFEDAARLKHSIPYFAANLIVLFIGGGLILVGKGFMRFYSSFLIIIILSFTAVSGYSSITIMQEYNRSRTMQMQENNTAHKKEKAYKVSKTGKNIFILMLDRSMNFFIDPIFEHNDLVRKEYTGFTLFKNAIAFGTSTNMSTPSLFGGYEYTPDNLNKRNSELLVDKHNEALSVLPKLFSENNWSVSFTDPCWLNYSWAPDLSVFSQYNMTAKNIDYTGTYKYDVLQNLKFEDKKLISGIQRNMLYFSFFRILPSEIRRVFYAFGAYASPVLEKSIKMSFVDAYSSIKNIIKEVEFVENKNCINIIVNNTTHEPPKQSDIKMLQKDFLIPLADKYCLNEYTAEHFYANYLTHEECAKFFHFLKENGCYNNSRIIIAGDHGRYSMKTIDMKFLKSFENTDFYPESSIPLFMIKDFDSVGELTVDNTFMTLADIPFLAVHGLDETLQKNPFTGVPFKDSIEKDSVKIMVGGNWQADKQLHLTQFQTSSKDWAVVKDDVYKPENWSRLE